MRKFKHTKTGIVGTNDPDLDSFLHFERGDEEVVHSNLWNGRLWPGAMLIATPLAHDAELAPCPIRDVQTPVLLDRVCAGDLRVISDFQGLDLGLVLVLDAN